MDRELMRDAIAPRRRWPYFHIQNSPVGFTAWRGRKGEKKRVGLMGVPSGNTALDRVVRMHELLHAARGEPTGGPGIDLVEQFIDDVRLYGKFWPKGPIPRQTIRDHQAVALNHLRAVPPKGATIKNNLAYNSMICSALRAWAILKRFGDRLRKSGETRFGAYYHGQGRLNRGDKRLARIFDHIIQVAQENKAQACALLASLLRSPPSSTPDDQVKTFEPENTYKGTAGRMRYSELPRTVDCQPAPEIVPCRSGPRMNSSRLVQAVLHNRTFGLFKKIIPIQPKGTVLIDGSGSMGASQERLSALCAVTPGAQVAYYYGNSDANGSDGELVLYAKNGMRFEGELPENAGGNAVDYPALCWLLKQPGPHTLISDLQFCGGPNVEIAMAHVLVEQNRLSGKLTVIRSIDEAMERFA